MILDEPRGEIIAVAAKPARFVDFAEPDARLVDRKNGGRDAGLVHVRERRFHRPWRQSGAGAIGEQHLAVERRNKVMVHIDAPGGRRR